jgi:putative FmdB family regulatory protein
MPIYEYRCEECGTVTDFLQKSAFVSEKVTCESCGSENVVRLLSTANVSVSGGRPAGKTCCGSDSRCDTPPCSVDNVCRR